MPNNEAYRVSVSTTVQIIEEFGVKSGPNGGSDPPIDNSESKVSTMPVTNLLMIERHSHLSA
jgi:hypothetical protein